MLGTPPQSKGRLVGERQGGLVLAQSNGSTYSPVSPELLPNELVVRQSASIDAAPE